MERLKFSDLLGAAPVLRPEASLYTTLAGNHCLR
nr:MAG TPA: hypothetical protein [Caudoviricetes sp.]